MLIFSHSVVIEYYMSHMLFFGVQKLGCFTFLHTIVYLIKIIYIVFIHKFKQIIDLNNLNGNKGAWINKAPSLNEV